MLGGESNLLATSTFQCNLDVMYELGGGEGMHMYLSRAVLAEGDMFNRGVEAF